jgi:hypothetical protein
VALATVVHCASPGFSRGECQLLVLADKQQNAEAPGAQWERYYADFFIGRYLK